jgi:hypothetical protein
MRSKYNKIASDPNAAGIARTVAETSPLGAPQAAKVALVDARELMSLELRDWVDSNTFRLTEYFLDSTAHSFTALDSA